MNPTQRAWAYVSRKRLRSLILFLILFVLLAGISACLTLMKSNKTVENNLYRSLNTSFSIKRIEADQTFQLSQLDDLKKIKGLEKISPELETIAKLTDKEVVTGEQSIQRDDLTEAEKNLSQFNCSWKILPRMSPLPVPPFTLKRRATPTKRR